MKVSFVNPSPNDEVSEWVKGTAAWPPLGLLYMATVLRGEGHEVSILDQPAEGLTVEGAARWVRREDPDILGFTTLSMSGRTAAKISREVKRWNPNLTIVFGSYYATFNARRVLTKYPYVDVVVRGEGERTIVDLVNALEKGGDLNEVRGITFRGRGSVVSTPDRPLIGDLDSLPLPDRGLLEAEYHSTIAGADIAVKKFTSLVTSRGCVYNCRFCSCRAMARGRWRPRSVDNIMDELRLLEAEGYRQLIFVDDCFTLDPRRTVELCRGMRGEGMEFNWICEGRVDSFSRETLKEISRAGCRILYLGVESANQRILNYYDKRITPDQSMRAAEKARRAGIDVIMGTFIVGAPDETREEIRNTLEFARRLPIDIPQFNVLGANPGQAIWYELRDRGFLDEDEYWETGVRAAEICPTAVPIREIEKMIIEAIYGFALRPRFLLGQAARTLGSRFRMGAMLRNLPRAGAIKEKLLKVV